MGHHLSDNPSASAPAQAPPVTAADPRPVPLRRFVLAWCVMVGGLVGFWCSRPILSASSFLYGQLVVLLVTWKIASLLCLPAQAWARFTPLRLLAYCIFIGMQPRQFLAGQRIAAGAPLPNLSAVVVNAITGAVLLWFVPRMLPAETPWALRLGIALVGFCYLFLFARLDFAALIFRAMGFAVEKMWDCPIAATSLGNFWGRRWNRIVPGFLREVIFLPVARRGGARVALLAVFLYSGLYHEIVSFMANAGYGRPFLYFMLQCLGVGIENTRRMRGWLQGRVWLARAWTLAVVFLPVGLFLHPPIVDGYLVPMLVAGGVRGLER
jgi:hypothetical protein